jgi:hypothetical protein
MNEQELKNLWNKINAKYKVKDLTYEQFKEKVSTQDLRRRFYEKYGAALQLGTVDEFEKRITTQSSTQTPTSTPSVPNKAVVIQRGKNNLKIAGSDAIIY